MNYLIMKSIIDATISHFACKECNSRITERDVIIVGSADQAVNMEVHCPQCHAISAIKAEINVMKNPWDISEMLSDGAEIAGLMNVELPLLDVQKPGSAGSAPKKEIIRDEDITALRNQLKGSPSVHDIFK